ncbi:unnamed protein product [Callosobruchus maculatus]|uniref:Uncharacterized protein n=1 Tax=Callosobruchus maculatus TaxID=64391 RepID=A0A653DBH9_CALMS|nr:unnamed protein product [Callosobruchus maculatus]
MAEEEDLDNLLQPLIAKKEMYFLRLQSLYEFSRNISGDPAVLAEFNARLNDIHKYRELFEQCIAEINRLNSAYKPKFKPNYQEIQSFDQLYYKILSVAATVANNSGGAGRRNESNANSNQPRSVKPRLPKLELFHFDSKLENWQTFFDTFSSLIHNNTDISNTEKFYYLLTAVSGPALSLVKSLPVTEDNYLIIWNLLVKKYENKRALATSHLDKLFQFKPLVTESAAGLNSFLQTFQESVKALKILKIDDLSSFLLFYIALRNLDPVTRREFEQTIEQDEIPTFQRLITFVEKHLRVIEMSESKASHTKHSNYKSLNSFSDSKPGTSKSSKACLSAVSLNKSNFKNCLFCQKPHSIYKCFKYNELTPRERLEKVKELKLCENCLRNHSVAQCLSKIRCSVCRQMHHHTLHIDGNAISESSQIQAAGSSKDQAVTLTCSSNSTVLLGTAVVHVSDAWGTYHAVRAIIDSGAMSSYITNACAQRLRLARKKCSFEPLGLGGNPVQDFGLITCSIKPRNSSGPILKTEAVVVSHITGNLPTITLSSEIVNEFRNLDLADPSYHTAAPVELLLAGDLFPYIYDGKNILPRTPGLPVAMHSIFGYVITGQTVLNTNDQRQTTSCNLLAYDSSIDKVIKSFWETENISCDLSQNPEDIYVEQKFSKEHSRDSTGRYIVTYPFKPNFELGDSREQAIRRFLNLESKLNRHCQLKQDYHEFMTEYESLGHMTCLGELDTVESKYTIPHFCILRPSSTSTKLRVVFDASSKTTNHNSLNHVLYAGPKLQSDINEILINFRLHKIGLSSDICKMFRMILVNTSQRPYQHILWRFSQNEPLKVYELNTLTYGIASSPYLSIRVLHQLADDSMKNFPIAATVLKRGFFVDNLLWSVETDEEAFQLQDELIALLRSGGFELHKWASNCLPLLERVPGKLREMPVAFEDDKDLSIKILGLQWLPLEDVLTFATLSASSTNTKRGVLSQIGRQFDPLGFVAPCIFYAKCFMQKLWMLKLGWDDQLPPHLSKEWHAYTSELHLLSNFKHERKVTARQYSYHQILGFCDASTLGYAAVIYLRSSNGRGDVKVSLLIAKSKVAPLKTISIPRLELLAAHLLAKLVKYTKSLLSDGLTIHDTYLFSDSSVVLAWLNTPCYHLKTFVATRVSKILDSVDPDCWFHVNGVCNPADICSRGAMPSTLLSMPEWLAGASWMYSPQTEWPIKSHSDFTSRDLPELKHSNVVLIQSCQTDSKADSRSYIYELSEKYSSFTKLQRVLAKCIQFFHNCKSTKSSRVYGSPSLSAMKKAQDALVKAVQNEHFSSDIEALQKGYNCSQSLRKLSPFLDELGFLRVGGRLAQSNLPYQKRHPLLLPKRCNFTRILLTTFINLTYTPVHVLFKVS